ncbi:MAG: acetolactate synthase [Planctomycetaceae bacterium]
MTMEFGDDSVVSPDTIRGRDWPTLRQFSVFLENQVGNLSELLRHLEGHDLRVMALSIVDSAECAIVRLMLDNYERGHELFKLSQFTVIETDLIGVELPDDPQPYVSIFKALLQAELNIHYTYPLNYRHRGRGAIAIYVEDLDGGLNTLSDLGFQIVTERDLQDDDEYF